MALSYQYNLILLLIFLIVPYTYVYAENTSKSILTVSTHDITVLRYNNKTFDVLVSNTFDQNITVTLKSQHDGLILLNPVEFTINSLDQEDRRINVFGLSPGHLEITAASVPNETWIAADVFVRVTVANSQSIIYTSIICGWIYFVAWSISFYPQIYTNFKRKSVIGLNFDYLALNIMGHTLYFIFNSGLYWIAEIQAEYSNRHPRGMNPVFLNDVIFSMHAVLATAVSIIQCFLYERADQRVSKTASGILTFFSLFLFVSLGLTIGHILHWLDFLYYCSYVKLAITIIKYVPQALMNYRRKSTTGWSIGNIILDFTGGILSVLQMMLNAYNYDDWRSIFGDPTKFGLGIFSVAFDIFFMLQHYVFYRYGYEVISSHSMQHSDSNMTSNTEIYATKPSTKSP